MSSMGAHSCECGPVHHITSTACLPAHLDRLTMGEPGEVSQLGGLYEYLGTRTRRLAPRGASVFRVPRRRSRRLELPTARIRTHAWRPDEWSTCFLSRRESRVPGQPDDVKSGHGRACSCIEARSSPAPHWSGWNWTPRPLIPPQGHAPPGTACTSTKYQDVGSTRRLETLLVSPQQPPSDTHLRASSPALPPPRPGRPQSRVSMSATPRWWPHPPSLSTPTSRCIVV